METVEFRAENGVLQYRTLCVYSGVQKNSDGDEYDGPLEENGYTEWRPLEVHRTPLVLALHLEAPLPLEAVGKVREQFSREVAGYGKGLGVAAIPFVIPHGMRLEVSGGSKPDERLAKLAQAWWDHVCGVLDEDQSEEATQIACEVLGIGDDDDE